MSGGLFRDEGNIAGRRMPIAMKPKHAVARNALRCALLAGLMAVGRIACAADAPASTDLPDLSAIRAQIYSGDYEKAAAALQALTPTVQHADLYNLLGYTYRKLKRYDEAARWYREALYYDGAHRPALEYQGELFIDIGDFANAEKNLELLRLACYPKGCEEYDKLKDALTRAGRKPNS
jgi:Flp pilus assembly protein TadD